MRILHFSDVHIGVESYGSTDPDTGLSTRLIDFLATFDEVVDFALDNSVDLVLFAGDAYKSRDPSQTHQREFARRIARLSREGVPVFLLVGNHDLPHIASRATALDIFPTLSVPNVTIGDRLDTYIVDTVAGPLQVVALPWIRRSAFLAREETRSLTIEQINRQLEERVTTMLTWQVESLDPAIPAVLTAHVSLNTAKTSSEQSMLLGRDPVLMQSALARPELDYVALGHIHKRQTLSQNPHVVYSGSLERIDFGEENDEKGFCIIDLDTEAPRGSASCRLSISARRRQALPHHRGRGRRGRRPHTGDDQGHRPQAYNRRHSQGEDYHAPGGGGATAGERGAGRTSVGPLRRAHSPGRHQGATHPAGGRFGGGVVAAGGAATVPGDDECAGGEGAGASELCGAPH